MASCRSATLACKRNPRGQSNLKPLRRILNPDPDTTDRSQPPARAESRTGGRWRRKEGRGGSRHVPSRWGRFRPWRPPGRSGPRPRPSSRSPGKALQCSDASDGWCWAVEEEETGRRGSGVFDAAAGRACRWGALDPPGVMVLSLLMWTGSTSGPLDPAAANGFWRHWNWKSCTVHKLSKPSTWHESQPRIGNRLASGLPPVKKAAPAPFACLPPC
jgi:hypothetical protein